MAEQEELSQPPYSNEGDDGGNGGGEQDEEDAGGGAMSSPIPTPMMIDGASASATKRKRDEEATVEPGTEETEPAHDSSLAKKPASGANQGDELDPNGTGDGAIPSAGGGSGNPDDYARNYLAQFDQVVYQQQQGSNGQGGGGVREGAIKEVVECPQHLVGRVIGRGGETIRDLQARSACDITVNQDFPEGQPRQVIITGIPEHVEAAKQMVQTVMESVSPPT